MKQKLISSFLILLFIFLLAFPKETFSGGTKGLLLWFNTLLPALLPCLIVSNLLVETNAFLFLTGFLSPFIRRLFHVSNASCYAIFIGFFCGYPMGAKTVSDLVQKDLISRQEAQYLLSFTNNTSPSFLFNYVLYSIISLKFYYRSALLIFFLSPVLCAQLFYLYYKRKFQISDRFINPPLTFHTGILDSSIFDSFRVLTKVGGYMILLSAIQSVLSRFYDHILISGMEITTGISMIAGSQYAFPLKYIMILALTTFGGLCSVFQTYSVIQEANLSIKPYIIQKLITTIVTSIFASLLFVI